MSSPFQRPTKILSFKERERLQRQLAEQMAERRGDLPKAPGVSDRERAQMQRFMDPNIRESPQFLDIRIKRLQQAIADGQVDSVSRYERGKLEKRQKELSEWLAKRMLSKSDLALNRKDPDFQKAVHFMAKNENSLTFQQKADELKQLRRQLNPDDPNAGNIEQIRPDST